MTTTMHVVNLSHPLELISHPLDGSILEVPSSADAALTGRQGHALMGAHSGKSSQLPAYLFGSTARRESTVKSDVDICIVRPDEVRDLDRSDWRDQIDTNSHKTNVWTGNDARVLESAVSEVPSLIGPDSVLASIRYEGIQLAGDGGLLHQLTVTDQPLRTQPCTAAAALHRLAQATEFFDSAEDERLQHPQRANEWVTDHTGGHCRS